MNNLTNNSAKAAQSKILGSWSYRRYRPSDRRPGAGARAGGHRAGAVTGEGERAEKRPAHCR
jgi:hypothetical protein